MTAEIGVAIWGPGAWLYGRPTAEILAPLMRPPIASEEAADTHAVRELQAGEQSIAGFRIHATAQPRHWAPTTGLRVDDDLEAVAGNVRIGVARVAGDRCDNAEHTLTWRTVNPTRSPPLGIVSLAAIEMVNFANDEAQKTSATRLPAARAFTNRLHRNRVAGSFARTKSRITDPRLQV